MALVKHDVQQYDVRAQRTADINNTGSPATPMPYLRLRRALTHKTVHLSFHTGPSPEAHTRSIVCELGKNKGPLDPAAAKIKAGDGKYQTSA